MHRILLTLALLLGVPAVTYSQPVIHFNEVRHDFGRVAQDEKITYVFEFSNTGNQPLIVEKLTPS